MKKAKLLTVDIIFIVLGSLIYAFSVNAFTAPNDIAPGGVTGIATILNSVIGTPIGLLMFVLNVPIIVWGIIEVGYKFVGKTIVAIVMMSAAVDLTIPLVPVYRGDDMVNALLAGAFQGVGLALVFIRGATTGGTDMAASLLGRRFRHLSMGKLMMIIDGVIVVVSMVAFKSIESGVYACVVIFVSTAIIDAILYGTDRGNGKMFFVISPKSDEIAERIMKDMERGVTFIKSRGGYAKTDGEMLFCAVRRFEIFKINSIIRAVDRDAFVIVGDAGEISGEGFKTTSSDDTPLKEIIKKVLKKKE